MSGRIRTVKPEILEDAVTAGLSDMAFRLFVSAIVLADDYGRLRFEPAWLQGQVYWSREVDRGTFAAAVAELEPLVRSYTVNGQRYGEIRNWSKHQKVSHPGKPRIPPPSDDSPPPPSSPPESLARTSGDFPESLVPDLRSPTKDHRPTTTDRQAHNDDGAQVCAPEPDAAVGAGAQSGARLVASPKSKRGSRLPPDWTPSAETQAWAREQGVRDPCGTTLDEFRDFWVGVPGAKGIKLDWDATYRNRVRQVAQRAAGPPRRAAGGGSLPRQPHDRGWLDRMAATDQGDPF